HKPAVVRGLAIVRREIRINVTAEHDVDVFEESRSNKESLRGHKFLCNSGEEFDCAGDLVFLHKLLQNDRRSHVDRLTRVVAFAVAGRAFNDWIVIGDAGFLRRSGDAIDVGDERDHRLACAVSRDPSGWHSSNPALDLEAVLLKYAGDVP